MTSGQQRDRVEELWASGSRFDAIALNAAKEQNRFEILGTDSLTWLHIFNAAQYLAAVDRQCHWDILNAHPEAFGAWRS